jgi:hypothetical protein
MTVRIDTGAGSRAIQEGKINDALESMMSRLQPEAVYFGPQHGFRTVFVVFDMKDPSDLVPISEPLYQQLGAELQFIPVMNREDLQAGFAKLAEQSAGPSNP